MLEVDEGVRWPEPLAQLVARDDDAGVVEQDFEEAQGLVGNGDALIPATQFAGRR